MDISLAGIEEALVGLGYRDTSPKARLIRTIHAFYRNSTFPNEIRTIDSDHLIDLMWDLGGDRKAIRSKRKNLSSIKSSVNQDLDVAWGEGRNPEGITIGPLNTFVMSDAAKDKILNSFSGSMNLDGGKSLDRVAEALKIVSDYLSEMPTDVKGEQLTNLKTLIESLSAKFSEGADGETKVIEKIVYRNGAVGEEDGSAKAAETQGDSEDIEGVEVLESDAFDEGEEAHMDGAIEEFQEIIEEEAPDDDEVVEEGVDELSEDELVEIDDEDLGAMDGDGEADSDLETGEGSDVEILDEGDLAEEIEDEIEDEDELDEVLEVEEGAVEAEGEEDAGPEIEDSDEVEIVYEDEPEDIEEVEENVEIDEAVEDEADEVELVNEEDVLEEETDDLTDVTEDVESGDVGADESDEIEFAEDEEELVEEVSSDSEEEADGIEIDDGEAEDADEIELMDEEDMVEVADDPEAVETDDEYEEVVEEDDELEELLEDDGEPVEPVEGAGEGVVELVGAEDLEEAEEVELVDEEDLAEEDDENIDDIEEVSGMEEALEDRGDELDDDMELVEEEMTGDEESEADETKPEDEISGSDVGLPIDQLMENDLDFDEFKLDEKQKRVLAERFDGYLGAMERYYNQYIFIKKGSYSVGAEETGGDVLPQQKVLLSDFFMGKYPVTNALFEVFIERTGYQTTAEKLGYGYVYHGRFRKVVDPKTGFASSTWNSTYTREKVEGATWYQPLGPGNTLHKKRNHPVVQVSLRDARTFAAWTGKRLPSEIEWEAAARSLAGQVFPWGNEWVEGLCNSENSGISDTSPVDYFPNGINEEGLADLLGNVMEWTLDECEPRYPMETPARFFIAKGSSWVSPEKTTLYGRSRFEADFTSNILGFRCVAD